MTGRMHIPVSLIAVILAVAANAWAEHIDIVRGVKGEGACAIVGMTPEQCRHLALQRARAAAIEKAAGVDVTQVQIVTDARMAVDYIRTYSRGYIVNELAPEWSGDFYQKDASSTPIPEYRVRLVADVYISKKKSVPLGLSARLNNTVFRSGESAKVRVRTRRDARIAIFNVMADDTVVMLFPNRYENDIVVASGVPSEFPRENSHIALRVDTLHGHERDAEAVFVVAMDPGRSADLVAMFGNDPLPLSVFFAKYAEISDEAEDEVLAYEVVTAGEQ